MSVEKVTCRTPNADGTTAIPKWKFDAIRRALLSAIDAAGPNGLVFKEASSRVRASLTPDDLSKLGSLGWHTTVVKLEMEVAREIARVPRVTPQRIVRCKSP